MKEQIKIMQQRIKNLKKQPEVIAAEKEALKRYEYMQGREDEHLKITGGKANE